MARFVCMKVAFSGPENKFYGSSVLLCTYLAYFWFKSCFSDIVQVISLQDGRKQSRIYLMSSGSDLNWES